MRRRRIFAAALAAFLSAGLPALGAPVATVTGATATYYLPAVAGTQLVVTQGQNTPTDHNAVNHSLYAWDFGVNGNAEFAVAAVAAGKVIGLRDNSQANCYLAPDGKTYDLSCWKDANYALLDLGGGVSALYVHLAYQSAVVKVGDQVSAGQKLAMDDNTGFSSANHLHFMFERTPTVPNAPAPGPTDKTAVAWWWTDSLNQPFSDPSVLAKAPDGIPTYRMTLTSSAPTVTATPTPRATAAVGGGLPAAAPAKTYVCSSLVTDAEVRQATGIADLSFSKTLSKYVGLTDCRFTSARFGWDLDVSVSTGDAYNTVFAGFWGFTPVVTLPGIGDMAQYNAHNVAGMAEVRGVGITVQLSQYIPNSAHGGPPLTGRDEKAAFQRLLTLLVGRV